MEVRLRGGGGLGTGSDCGKEVKRCVQAGWNGWGKSARGDT